VNAVETVLRQIFPIIIMTAILYFVLVIPQNKRKKEYNSMMNNLKVNDEIITKGGLIGTIVSIQDEFVIIQSGPDRTKLKLAKAGILDKVNKVEEVRNEEKSEIGYK
jgi:preprotein translocase subunit YajC